MQIRSWNGNTFSCVFIFFTGCIMLRPFNISLLCLTLFKYLKARATFLFRTRLIQKIMFHLLKKYEMTPWLKPFPKKTISKSISLLDVRTWLFSLAHNIRSFQSQAHSTLLPSYRLGGTRRNCDRYQWSCYSSVTCRRRFKDRDKYNWTQSSKLLPP